jgi:hypothetical protein
MRRVVPHQTLVSRVCPGDLLSSRISVRRTSRKAIIAEARGMSDLIKLSLQKRAVGSVVASPDVERELHLVVFSNEKLEAWLIRRGENTPQERRGLFTRSPVIEAYRRWNTRFPTRFVTERLSTSMT